MLNLTFQNDQAPALNATNMNSIVSEINVAQGLVAEDYDPSSAYAVGDYCIYGGELYRCVVEIGAGGEAWTAAHWVEVNVTGEISDVKSALENDTFHILGHISLDEGGVTPDNAPGVPGYYIASSPITQEYTGVYTQSVFIVLCSPSHNQYRQLFILPDGRLFLRNGNTGVFTCNVDTTLSVSGLSADAKAAGDALSEFKSIVGNIYNGSASLVETHEGVYLNYSSGELIENANFNVRDYSVIGLSGAKVICDTTFYGTSTAWAFIDSNNQIVEKGHGNTASAVYAYTIEQTIPSNATIFRVTERIADSQTTFSFKVTDAVKIYNGTTLNNIRFSSSPTETVTDASDSHGGVFNLYLPYSPSEYIKVAFIHGTRSDYTGSGSPTYHNGDVFRLEGGIIGSIEGYEFTPSKTAITSGAWEAAIYKNNRGSAVGTFHGWEKFSRCIIQVDGKVVANLTPSLSDLPSIPMSSANNVDILYWAEVFEMPPEGTTTETKLLDAFRRYHIERNQITLTQRNTWVPSGTHGIYVGMGCVSRTLTDRAVCDYDYVLYDVSNQNETAISGSANAKPNVTYAKEFGTSSGVSETITVNPACNFYVENVASASYNKLYFRYVKETSAGESWNNTTVFTLGG